MRPAPVFISWSGEESHHLAVALRRWLPDVIQGVEPWLSAIDIVAGARWQAQVADRLSQSKFSIICLTPTNIHAPWLLFEAGALSKTIDSTFVCPLLLGAEPKDLPGPLKQFQAATSDRAGILQMIHSLNQSLGICALAPTHLLKAFEKWWPELESTLQEISTRQAEAADQRLVVIHDRSERARRIFSSLDSLHNNLSNRRNSFVRYSGFLSAFAIPNDERDDPLEQAESNATEWNDYQDQLMSERKAMLALARSGRCTVRCIITPPMKGFIVRNRTRAVLRRLQELQRLLETPSPEEAEALRGIEWAISPFQQKNMYIVGHIAYFEGFKRSMESGYRFTLHYSGEEEIAVNAEMYDELFRHLEVSTLTSYPSPGSESDSRRALRNSVLQCVKQSIRDVGEETANGA